MATLPPTSSSAKSAPKQALSAAAPAVRPTLWDQLLSELGLPSEKPGTNINLLEIPLPPPTSSPPAHPQPPSAEPQTAVAPNKASRAARASSSRSQKRPAPQTLVRGAHDKFSKWTTTSTSKTPEKVKTTETTPTPACDQVATDEAESLNNFTFSVIVVHPPPFDPIDLTPPTPNELSDCIITCAILPYLHFHSHTVLEYESRSQFVLMHYRTQLIAFIDTEISKV